MKIILYTLSIVILSFSVSCKKKAADVNSDYVGYWHGYDADKAYVLTIQPDSKCVYESSGDVATTTVKGKARVKGNTLKVSIKKFTIDQAPVEDQDDPSRFTMILDGIVYERWF